VDVKTSRLITVEAIANRLVFIARIYTLLNRGLSQQYKSFVNQMFARLADPLIDRAGGLPARTRFQGEVLARQVKLSYARYMLSKLSPLFCICIPIILSAQSPDVVIDQQFTYTVSGPPAIRDIDQNGLGGGAANIAFLVGQEFTPSLTAMNFFDLYTADVNPHDGFGVILSMAIRRNQADGLEVGQSQNLALPDGFDGVTRFTFSDIVSLTPGVVHTAEVEIIGGTDSWALAMNIRTDAYAGGRLVGDFGSVDSSVDAWFREGLIIPEPSAKWLLIFGACVLGFRLSLLPRCQ
jgi:hypothetical protein